MVATWSGADTGFEGAFSSVLERIRKNVSVDLACGESRVVDETTIFPIGVVGYGFGFGMGSQPDSRGEGGPAQEGGGGGGGAWIQPIAVVSVTNGQVKVTPVLDWARVLAAAISAIGKLLLSRNERGRSAFGPGVMVVPTRGKRGRGKHEDVGTTIEREDSDERTV